MPDADNIQHSYRPHYVGHDYNETGRFNGIPAESRYAQFYILNALADEI